MKNTILTAAFVALTGIASAQTPAPAAVSAAGTPARTAMCAAGYVEGEGTVTEAVHFYWCETAYCGAGIPVATEPGIPCAGEYSIITEFNDRYLCGRSYE